MGYAISPAVVDYGAAVVSDPHVEVGATGGSVVNSNDSDNELLESESEPIFIEENPENVELLEEEPILNMSDEESSILEETIEAEPEEGTDESRYESTSEAFSDVGDREVGDEHESFESESESPPTVRRSSRNVRPPPVFTYDQVGGEPSVCHRTARPRR